MKRASGRASLLTWGERGGFKVPDLAMAAGLEGFQLISQALGGGVAPCNSCAFHPPLGSIWLALLRCCQPRPLQRPCSALPSPCQLPPRLSSEALASQNPFGWGRGEGAAEEF